MLLYPKSQGDRYERGQRERDRNPVRNRSVDIKNKRKREEKDEKRHEIENSGSTEGHVIVREYRSTGTDSTGDQLRRILSNRWKQWHQFINTDRVK